MIILVLLKVYGAGDFSVFSIYAEHTCFVQYRIQYRIQVIV